MKNTIAGASFVIASAICVLAFAMIDADVRIMKHVGQILFPFAWVIYFGLGLYFLFDRKFSIPIHIPTQQETSPPPPNNKSEPQSKDSGSANTSNP